MRTLKTSLVVGLPALLAGYVAWLFIPCQPERNFPVPFGTMLVEFSPAGQYVVTFDPEIHELIIRNCEGQPRYSAKIPTEFDLDLMNHFDSVNHLKGFYAFSAHDRWFTVATGQPSNPKLVIVDLHSNNAVIPAADLAADPDINPPRPAFSSDDRFLSYFRWDERDWGNWFAVLYDITAKREHLRIPGFSESLGPPTPRGQWFLPKEGKKPVIESWNINQKRRTGLLSLAALGLRQPGKQIIQASVSEDEQAIIALCGIENPSTEQGFALYRIDSNSQALKSSWEYRIPASARLFWHTGFSDRFQCLLIKTLDDRGNLVEDLLDVDSGEIVARYPQPIDYEITTLYRGAGFAQAVGRTGDIVIDSKREMLVSKQLAWPTLWWEDFGAPPDWLGLRIPPPLTQLQFHSAQTGKLLERVTIHSAYDQFDPVLAMHPTEPLVAVIGEKDGEAHLQFWRVPPPKPWTWIIVSALSGGAIAFLIRFGLSKRRKSVRSS